MTNVAPGLIAPPAAVTPCGAMVPPVTPGAWKSMLARAAPAPAPGRCHVADAVVTPARNTTRSTRLRRGCSMPLRRAGIGTALGAGGRGGQVDRERRSLARVVGGAAHRDGARGVDIERGVRRDVPAAAAVRGGRERQGAEIAAAVAGVDT